MPTGAQIVTDFVVALRRVPGLTVARTAVSHNVFELNGSVRCLLYIKGRAESPYRWGVTGNVVSRLKSQDKDWHVVLLYEAKDTGYLLSASDVLHYMGGIWPLGADGDYKPAPGSYLYRNSPFESFGTFTRLVCAAAG